MSGVPREIREHRAEVSARLKRTVPPVVSAYLLVNRGFRDQDSRVFIKGLLQTLDAAWDLAAEAIEQGQEPTPELVAARRAQWEAERQADIAAAARRRKRRSPRAEARA